MKLFSVFSVVFLAIASAKSALLPASEANTIYDGSQLIRVKASSTLLETSSFLQILQELESRYPEIDFWLEPSTKRDRPVDIFIPSADVSSIKRFFRENGIPFTVLIENVGQLIHEQNEEISRMNQDGEMNWNNYQRYETISSFVDQLALDHPSTCNVTIYGNSTEGRPLKVVKIGVDTGASKPAFFLDGGIHAREWISPAIVTWFMRELLTNSSYQDVLQNLDIYIVPSANPDGYEFTHTTQRLWRKTRSNYNSPGNCIGVDPNRNFPYEWGGLGTSDNPCSDIYKGPEPLSEPETRGMVDFIMAKKDEGTDWVAYFAMHSYAQMWLTPWGWSFDLPETYDDLITFGHVGADALEAVHGTVFEVGSVTELLSPGAGGSDDWAYGSGIFRYSQTVEVRDTGRYGFLLPPDQIIPAAEETFQAIVAVARFVSESKNY